MSINAGHANILQSKRILLGPKMAGNNQNNSFQLILYIIDCEVAVV